jgi:hypothetical protein
VTLWPLGLAAGSIVAALAPAALADWAPVAPGFEYQHFAVAGPNQVFVVRMDRSNAATTIDSLIGQERLTGGTETVSGMAARHEDTIGYWGQTWGQRYDVVAAINGDFYSGGIPYSGQIASGWYAKRFTDFTGGSGFAWQLDRDAFIGGCVRHIANKQRVIYPATSQDQNINGINVARGANQLVLYTHHYDLDTNTDSTGVEVVVRMARPTLILPFPAYASGTVIAVNNGSGSTVIPWDAVVLSATGAAATKLLANAPLGAEVRITQEITHYESDCSTPRPWDWTKTYAAIGGSFHFLKNSLIQNTSDPGLIARHPRTAIALNSAHVFFVVVDGRSEISVGMDMFELGTFCRDVLGATEGLNQDGGGSSTLWVNGQIVNVPSDGQERPVANGMFMAVVQPTEQSARFAPGDLVSVNASGALRVGPGLNFLTITTLPPGTIAPVIAHSQAGIRASGTYWWPCSPDGLSGWLPSSALLPAGCAGDFDADGAIESDDWLDFEACWTVPDAAYPGGHACLAADADGDADADLRDAARLQACFGR